MHTVAVLALDGVIAFEVGIAAAIFGRARLSADEAAYSVEVCSERPRVRTEGFDILAPHRLDRIAAADTVIIAGVLDPEAPVSSKVLEAIGDAWTRGARVASLCTGAFVLAQTGLLDGLRATTHWVEAANFSRRFPKVSLDPQVLFVDEGRILTAAGASAALDLCLHLVGRDHGQAAAAQASRLAVAPLQRDGGQAQFIQHDPPRSNDSLAPLLEWMLSRLDTPLSIEALAARAATSPRTFARRFREQTGTTPHQWLLHARIRHAQELLETTPHSLDGVALASGFEATVTFRTRFQQIVGISPNMYRRRFRSSLPSSRRAGSPAQAEA